MFNWYHVSRWASSVMRVNCCILLLATFIMYTTQNTRAESVTLQNDTVANGGSAALMVGFRAADVGVSVFSLPPGVEALRITSIDIAFGADPAYGALDTSVDVLLFCGTLGAPVSTKVPGGAMLRPGVNTVPISSPQEWIVRGDFAVGVKYLWGIGGIDQKSAHLLTDADGCQSGKNYVMDGETGEWFDPCVNGIPGDFAIRVTGEVIPAKVAFGDFDQDADVDATDFAALQRCLTPVGGEPAPAECQTTFDCDRDGYVGQVDLDQFVTCASGPGIPLDPACGTCLPEGVCPAASPLKVTLSPQKVLAFPWIFVGIVALVLLIWGLVDYYWLTPMRVTSARNAWLGQVRCPSSTTDQARLREAMIYLRDTLGATDADARNIGTFMMNNKWYECGAVLIAEGPVGRPAGAPQPDKLIANTQDMTIFVDRDFVEVLYFKEVLAMILYGQACHFMDIRGELVINADDRALNFRLDLFRIVHNAENWWPDYRHGAPEGVIDDADD